MMLEKKLIKILTVQKKTLAVAESCSGGLLSHRITNVSGSSKIFKFGLTTYANEAKIKFLKVPRLILHRYGAVSAPVTLLMAQNVRKLLQTDFGVGITGIAGPTGATKAKPVGLTYIAISAKGRNVCCKYIFKGSRLHIKRRASTMALQKLLELIS